MKTNTLDFDAQALRERILDLAMRGKLVPQDPNDEPASVLLEKIKAEKEELVKEKKIKKSKPLPAITDDEKPFNIPDSWEWVRLGDLGNYIQRGRSPKYDKNNTTHPIISQKCVQWDNISLEHAKYITEEFFEKLEEYRFVKKNDILWNSTGTGTVGRLNIVKEDLNHVPVDSHVTLIRTNDQVFSDYVYYYLMSPQIQNNLGDFLTGTTKQKELGLTNILKVEVPLPPFSEQSRIAAKIAQLFALLRKVESSTQQYAELQTLLKSKVLDLAMHGKLVKQDPNDEPASVLLEKIKAEKAELVKEKKIKKSKPIPPITDEEKPFDIPDSWEWVRLGDYTFNYDGKRIPVSVAERRKRKKIYDYYGASGKIDKIDNFLFSKPLLLISEDGANLLARSKPIAFVAYGKYWVNNHAHIMDSINIDVLKFIANYINATKLDQYITGTAQPKLNQQNLNKILIPVPPVNEQKRINDQLFKISQFLEGASK
ncbi:restriction endonuclease subunit S [Lactobacillus amylovorus]|uniref:restriction endonuclease subunit S n=2 Tax=Lactobacillus amylovorus TaxID=1604 RepID=UPI00201DB853|nr:restriction endonuclease subunit S [Lactobacillus amylovorus]